MKILILILASLTLSTNGLLFRHKRQLEVEGDPQPNSPTNDVVVIKDVNSDNGPSYQLIPVDPNTGVPIGSGGLDSDSSGSGSSGTDIVDLDINEDDGTFRLGGRIPSLHFHHTSFAEMFRAIQERFDEMARRMAENFGHSIDTSSGSIFPHIHSPCCGHGAENGGGHDGQGSGGEGASASGEGGLEVASLPENYNNTKTEIVTIRGRQFLKKTTVIKKGGPGTSIYISSTTYEPINEAENGTSGSDESDLKPASSGSGSDVSTGTNYGTTGSDGNSDVSSSSTTESTIPSQPVPQGEPSSSSGSSSTTSTETGLKREELTSPTPVLPV